MENVQALEDILWFRNNPERYVSSRPETLKRINTVIRDASNHTIDSLDSWQALYDIFGPNTYNRDCHIIYDNPRKREMSYILQELTTEDKNNLKACKELLKLVTCSDDPSTLHEEVWDVLDKVINDQIQPVLALGDLVRRFPKLFDK